MRINKCFIGLMAAASLAACSSDDGMEWTDAGNTGIETPVEIRLSSGALTRGSVESTANGLFEANGMGLFCLAVDYLKINPEETNLSWTPATGSVPNYAIVIDNDSINAVKNGAGTEVDLVWVVTISGQTIFDAKLSKHHSYSSSLPK